MNPILQTLSNTLDNTNDRPLFCPAIYDLKAKLAGCDPAHYAKNAEELCTAMKKEFEEFNLKIITSGFDLYNIEAEAVGGEVKRKDKFMPVIEDPLINSHDEVVFLKKIGKPGGRMGIFIDAARNFASEHPDLYVRCGISGPFSMASRIYPGDRLLADCLINSHLISGLMRYCTDIIKIYLEAILENHLEVVVFDSFASPPLVSPEIYGEMIFPFHKELFDLILQRNLIYRPLILGGNSIALLDQLTGTGANSFLLDYNIDDSERMAILKQYKNFAFRVNIDPAIICQRSPEKISAYMSAFLDRFSGFRNILIGTGILPYDTPLENLKRVCCIIEDYYSI